MIIRNYLGLAAILEAFVSGVTSTSFANKTAFEKQNDRNPFDKVRESSRFANCVIYHHISDELKEIEVEYD